MQHRRVREQHLDARVLALRGEARVGLRRIEPDVPAARTKHGERADNRRRRAVVADADEHAGSHAERPEPQGERVGGRIELAVGQASAGIVDDAVAVEHTRRETC